MMLTFFTVSDKLVMIIIIFIGKVKDGVLHIGSTSYPVSDSRQAAAMVPDVLFYDNQLVSSLHHLIITSFLNVCFNNC